MQLSRTIQEITNLIKHEPTTMYDRNYGGFDYDSTVLSTG